MHNKTNKQITNWWKGWKKTYDETWAKVGGNMPNPQIVFIIILWLSFLKLSSVCWYSSVDRLAWPLGDAAAPSSQCPSQTGEKVFCISAISFSPWSVLNRTSQWNSALALHILQCSSYRCLWSWRQCYSAVDTQTLHQHAMFLICLESHAIEVPRSKVSIS